MFWRRLQQAIFYLSFLAFPAAIYIVWRLVLAPAELLWWSLLLLIVVFIYARFVEPQRIIVRRERKEFRAGGRPVRIALISDLHLGVFKGERFLRRILAKIRAAEVDLVIIPGDLINDPSRQELSRVFLPLAELDRPIYVVTGNHDARKPGYYRSEEVREVLRPLVQVMDNAVSDWWEGDRRVKLFGLSDLMEGQADYEILEGMSPDDFNLVIAHNPDAAYLMAERLPAHLVVSGHTHAGQIRLPPISNWLIPTKFPFIRGWYQVNGRPVYVSSGLGEVGLPMRFLIPPEVVILDLVI
jgi:predicted MPP superfamily phosphohydrolase